MFIEPGQGTGIDLFPIGFHMIHPTHHRQYSGQEATQHEDEKRVFSEYLKEFTPSSFGLLELDPIDQYTDRHQCLSGSIQYIRAGPYFFIDREELIPAETGKDHESAGDEKIRQ